MSTEHVSARVRATLQERADAMAAGPRNESELARALGWHRSTLRTYLDGGRAWTPDRIEAVARVLNLDVDALTD